MPARIESLKYMPEISKWKTKNVIRKAYIFSYCKSLEYIPDISNWAADIILQI